MTALSSQGTAYDLVGPESAPAVVLIHGLGLERKITWNNFVAPLAQQYRVLSYDLCGHGQSTLPSRTPSLSVLSDQLLELLCELKIEQAALVGFSLGGMINRRFAMDHPERVSALAVLSSPHERGEKKQREVEENAARTAEGGIQAIIDTLLNRWLTEEYRRENESDVNAIRSTVLANDLPNYAQHRQVLANGVIELIRPAPPIAKPCLLMTCENDTGSTPAMSQAIAGEIEGSETIIVPSLQHLGMIEKPDLFIDPLLDFLRRSIGSDTG